MFVKILCDRCKKEFEMEEYDYRVFSENGWEIVCDDCKNDSNN